MSILGPLLVLIYINDIVAELYSNCNVRLFADDTSLYVIVENPITAGNILNRNLLSIHSWATAWLVDFNPAKTESMVISRKRIKNKKSRKENPQKLTQLSSRSHPRSHPRHLVGKRTAQKDTIIDITSDSQVNSNFPYRWSPASLTFNNYFYLFLYLYIT